MDLGETVNRSRNGLENCKISYFQHFIFITIIISLFYLYKINYYLYHMAAEMFSCIIAGGIFMISLNTYYFTKNNYFMFIGIGYIFILVFDIFHAISFDSFIVQRHFVYDLETRLWVAARGLELFTFLISFVFLYKPKNKFNFYYVFIIFYIISGFLFLDILHFNILIPTMRIEGIGMTQNKIHFENFTAAGFVLCFLILYFARKKIDKNLFIFLEISLICKAISEIFFTMYFNVTDIYNMIGHIFKVISYYFLYFGIIVNGLQRPYDMIKHDLDNVGNILKEKEKQRCYMEEVLHYNEKCYDWLIDNSSNGIVIVRKHEIVYANKTAVHILGAKDIMDVSGRDAKEFLLDNSIDSNKFSEIVNSSIFNELNILKINKETIDVEYTINYITYRGTPAYLILLRDLKLKKEVNNLKNNLIENEIELNKSNEFNKVLTEFFSNISHDLKTPINVILSAVQLLMFKQKTTSNEDFMKQLNRLLIIIKQNGFRLIRLVSNLIDTSKYEAGFLKLELKNHNIVSIVEDITMSVCDYIKSRDVNIIFDTDYEERIIAVDADKIERIMLNLLSNAVKFTGKGGEIFVNIENDVNYVKISVKDTGIGIPEEKIKVIFDRFAQVENSLIKNKEGSGIGLSLVKFLTEMQGGNINVISKVGEGSEFIVELPVKLTENNEMESIDYEKDNKIEKVLIEFSDIYSFD